MPAEPKSGQRGEWACCAKNCPSFSCSTTGSAAPAPLHPFPPRGSRRYKLWAGMVGVTPLPVAPKLCSLHFSPDQYKQTGIGRTSPGTLIRGDRTKPRKLRKDALPSLFYDSDGETFEMVPVTVPACSDEDPDDVHCSVLGDLQSVGMEGQGNVLLSEEETGRNCNYRPHCNGVTQQRCRQYVNYGHKVDVGVCDSPRAGSEVSRTLQENGRFGNDAHGCNFCGESFSSCLNLGSHLRVHRTFPLKCHSCGLCLSNHWKLNQHLKVHGRGFPVRRASCVSTPVGSCELQLRTPSSPECRDCGRRFESQFWLAMHSQVHSASWQKAQERVLLRRKESSEKAAFHQPITAILQGSFSVLTQSPLFHSGDILRKGNPVEADMSQLIAQNIPSGNSISYGSTLPPKAPEIPPSRTDHPKDFKQYWLNIEHTALESRPKTLLKICPFDPRRKARDSNITNMGFVKKVYLCEENMETALLSDEKNKVNLERRTEKPAAHKDRGSLESRRLVPKAPEKPRVNPPYLSLSSLTARRCSDCGGRFTWPHSLALHRRKRHRRRSSSKQECQCGRLFGSRLDLLHHELGHVRSGHYICCQCGTLCKRSTRLLSHWQKHHGNRPLLKCVCGLTFKRIENFVWHLLRNKA
ncbi:hypothetical protein AGOR_G00212900 [Albula goreensis]|uniref:Uncharacterized protein n=1 Tax=Albula goreensis TaxID=1534307 RepID=A0A8T3CQT2_9TELE|nr:hypothetical protein AGOR_G00212900 [Albula goreensis]